MSVDVTFRVSVETDPEEVVCIVGDCPELGQWLPQHAVKLQRDTNLGLVQEQELFYLFIAKLS